MNNSVAIMLGIFLGGCSPDLWSEFAAESATISCFTVEEAKEVAERQLRSELGEERYEKYNPVERFAKDQDDYFWIKYQATGRYRLPGYYWDIFVTKKTCCASFMAGK